VGGQAGEEGGWRGGVHAHYILCRRGNGLYGGILARA
jgi:hypothetical protein